MVAEQIYFLGLSTDDGTRKDKFLISSYKFVLKNVPNSIM